MFEYIKLKNFKSFDNIEFNLLDKRNNPKKLVLIYGENGVGKSNIASAFFMLSETLRTMDVRDIMEIILSENSTDIKSNDVLKKYIHSRYKDLETLIKENKTVDTAESMYMEFGFRINDKSGKYIIEMDNTQIIHEKLEYTLTKKRGIYFDISDKKTSINNKIFLDKDSYQEIKSACNKFWGKHSFLSILLHEADDKSDHYIKEKISENFNLVLEFLSRLSCKIKFGNKEERGVIGLPHEILGKYEKGSISLEDEEVLLKTEKMFSMFLKCTCKNIESAYYKKKYQDSKIKYELVLRKNIAGKIKDIDFSIESTGIQSMLQQLPFMLVASKGSTAIIDEFDTGIHDLLVKELILSLLEDIDGQLILTTHNTLLMESDIPKESIYVINEQDSCNKEIQCILYYDNKIGTRNNIRNQYFAGKYKGIPTTKKINFHELLNELK